MNNSVGHSSHGASPASPRPSETAHEGELPPPQLTVDRPEDRAVVDAQVKLLYDDVSQLRD